MGEQKQKEQIYQARYFRNTWVISLSLLHFCRINDKFNKEIVE